MGFRTTLAFAAMAAALTCGCVIETETSRSTSTESASGYALDIFANDAERVYVVRGADGRSAAARADDSGSAIIELAAAQALMPNSLTADEGDGDARISIRAPGFSMQINADEDSAGEGGAARVDINAGGHRVLVDAEGEGDDGRAVVHIAGADENAAREFIDDAEGLSDETRAQMRTALGL